MLNNFHILSLVESQQAGESKIAVVVSFAQKNLRTVAYPIH